jgi:starch synthase (maltosyl-transferring)
MCAATKIMSKKNTTTISKPFDKTGRSRVIIEDVTPLIEGGLYPAKRVEQEWVVVEADVFTDGHDLCTPVLMYRKKGAKVWNDVFMQPTSNDRWSAAFQCTEKGYFEFTIRAFIDHCLTWHHAFVKRLSENDTKELDLQLQIGIQFLQKIAKKYTKAKALCKNWIENLQSENAYTFASSKELEEIFIQYPIEEFPIQYEKTLEVVAHRKRAGFSAWYSFFPRSASLVTGNHGTFKDCELLLPRIKEMGFDVVYFPPIHPIGLAFRKGKNNSLNTNPDEPGCPYATGSELGGHKAILPELGTLADFKKLVKETHNMGMEIAMDFAIQCSPDHPYVKDNPQWFKWRPDGTVQYAENPPKKYQDVLPLDYENEDWQNMWFELKSILEYWIEQGVQIFRVDNPHTKSFVFWQWCLNEIEKEYPDVIFLSEAFTRPRIMENLAKKGYHQSYTYFTWRNNKAELMQYMSELTQTNLREYFRPNFWPNTHDINPYILQSGHEPQYIIRAFLASTLSSNYGIFGPCYELIEHAALPGKEEYLDSEKYEVRYWDWSKRNKLIQVISLINKARNENEALQFTNNYISCHVDNDNIMAWSKVFDSNRIICIVNMDAYHKQSGSIYIQSQLSGRQDWENFNVVDLVTGEQYQWKNGHNYIELDPHKMPFHLFRIE